MPRVLAALAVLHTALALRVTSRMIFTGGTTIPQAVAPRTKATVVVPVLNEVGRLGPCLDALYAQGPHVREILVVDGGSVDGTAALIDEAARRDSRVRRIDANPVPEGWNGKAWGLARGIAASNSQHEWIVTIDADVRPSSTLTGSLLAFAQGCALDAFSVATRQCVDGAFASMLHPALLATLVYRYGRPGNVASRAGDVQANGQCFVARRSALVTVDPFRLARASRAEDVTAARALVAAGFKVGFYASDDPVTVTMHDGWRDTLANWPRSLPLLDSYARASTIVRLIEFMAVSVLPMPLACVLRRLPRVWQVLTIALLALRLGTLFGMRGAYARVSPAYWLSPLCDVPAAVLLLSSALRRRHTWRGRVLVEAGR